ncbi:hypothetical protein VN97_g432 [Penicillium thymicola]|uniref:Uncharacterized protein n=1 Tax=Penicillium thymicola TaxID=293382 RepID=A0AAI9XD74_PENTH|nr:hypothetical protein VN97_g432 [Penicillium thymicola]
MYPVPPITLILCTSIPLLLTRLSKIKKKSLPRGIEPRSPALIGVNDKRKSSPLDQGRCDDRVYCSTTWLVDRRKWLS